MFAKKIKNIASIIAVVCVCAGLCACSNLDSSKSGGGKTVTSKNTNSVYVASQTDVVSQDEAPVATTATTVTTTRVTTPVSETTEKKTTTTSVTTSKKKSSQTTTTTTTTKKPETTTPATTTTQKPVTTTAVTEPVVKVVTNPVDNSQLILEGMAEGDRAVYDRISQAIDSFEKVVEFEFRTVTQTQVENSLLLVSLAKLEDGYVSTKYVISVDDMGYVSKLELEYTKTEEQHREETAELEGVIEEIINGCTAKDNYGVLKYFHDQIIERCVYNAEAENMLNAYGCLVEGRAVCEGYAKAFILLCSRYGIECVPVVGTTLDEDGEAVPHMWNMVKLDEKWYHFDLTWDDPITTIGDDFIKYDYFALSDEEISQDHVITGFVHFEYPVADDKENDYFEVSGLACDKAVVAAALLENQIITAADKEERFVRVRVDSEEEFEKLNAMLFEADENGVKEIFAMLNRASVMSENEYFNPRRYSKVVSEDKNILTIILNFE